MRPRPRPVPTIWLALGPFAASIAYAVARPGALPARYGVVPLAALLLGLAAVAIAAYRLHHDAARARHALARWGAGQGLVPWPAPAPARGSCLLLDRADARVEGVVHGRVVGARVGDVAHVSLPSRRARLVDGGALLGPLAWPRGDDWTLVQLGLEHDEHEGLERLVVDARGLLDSPGLRVLRDALSPLRRVELESIELERRHAVLVDDAADDVAVRALLTPAAVAGLVERRDLPVLVEVRGARLTIALPGRATTPAGLDAVLAEAAAIAGVLAPAIAREPRHVRPVTAPADDVRPPVRRGALVAGGLVVVGLVAYVALRAP